MKPDARRAFFAAMIVFGVFAGIAFAFTGWLLPFTVLVGFFAALITFCQVATPRQARRRTTDLLPPECEDRLRGLEIYPVTAEGHYAKYALPVGWYVTKDKPADTFFPFPPNTLIFNERHGLVAYTTGELCHQRLILVK